MFSIQKNKLHLSPSQDHLRSVQQIQEAIPAEHSARYLDRKSERAYVCTHCGVFWIKEFPSFEPSRQDFSSLYQSLKVWRKLGICAVFVKLMGDRRERVKFAFEIEQMKVLLKMLSYY